MTPLTACSYHATSYISASLHSKNDWKIKNYLFLIQETSFAYSQETDARGHSCDVHRKESHKSFVDLSKIIAIECVWLVLADSKNEQFQIS